MNNIITDFEKFNEGLFTPKVIYRKSGSKNDGKSGIFVKTREDGKYSILFDDGTKFAADPKFVHTYNEEEKIKADRKKIDPYDEENWEDDEIKPTIKKVNVVRPILTEEERLKMRLERWRREQSGRYEDEYGLGDYYDRANRKALDYSDNAEIEMWLKKRGILKKEQERHDDWEVG